MPATPRPRSSASPTGRSRGERERRKACQYCFKRKMKCDMLDPCNNCTENGKECVDADRLTRPRPTHEKIERLEKEISDLDSLLRTITGLSTSMITEAINNWKRSGTLSASLTATQSTRGMLDPRTTDIISSSPSQAATGKTAEALAERPNVHTIHSRLQYGQSGHTSAHGPTSAFFDNIADDGYAKFNTPSVVLDMSAESALREQAFARCAEERHREILNLASGRFDFDGISPELAMHLLALHWNRQHFGFMVSYRPLFTRDMACNGPYFSKLLLNAIYFSVSKFSERPDVYDDPSDQKTAGRGFLRRCKELLGEALDQSSIPTVQAMLLLSSSLFALGQQSAAWLYSGIAIRMIFDMGLNYGTLNVGEDLPAEEIEIRRRIVWSAFVYDKIISLYQGRAVSFDEDQVHVPHQFLDYYEEQELWTPYAFPGVARYPGAPGRAISTFSSFCALSVIMGRVITHIYAEKTLPSRPAEYLSRLTANLDRWKRDLPVTIAYDPGDDALPVPPPHVLSLHMVYWTVVTLLHRPFVEAGHHHLSDPARVQVCWTKCEEAAVGATALLSRYRETFSLARAPYLIVSRCSLQLKTLSYTTYVAATIHVRITAQRGPQSDAARSLAICLEGLQENAATNPGVRKMYETIRNLMKRLKVSPPFEESDVDQSIPEPYSSEGLDLTAIISSFANDPTLANGLFAEYGSLASKEDPTACNVIHLEQPQDFLYGFLNIQ